MKQTEIRFVVPEPIERWFQQCLLELAKKRRVRKVTKAQAVIEGLNLLFSQTIGQKYPPVAENDGRVC